MLVGWSRQVMDVDASGVRGERHKNEDHTMKFDLFLSFLLGWVCVSFLFGVI